MTEVFADYYGDGRTVSNKKLVKAIREATDEELKELDGVGDWTVRQLRKQCGKDSKKYRQFDDYATTSDRISDECGLESVTDIIRCAVENVPWEMWGRYHYSLHDTVQSEIVAELNRQGYTGVAELGSCNGEDQIPIDGNKRIDVGVIHQDELVAVIEIDGTIKKKSVRKLKQFPDRVQKIIISKGRSSKCRIEQRVRDHLPDKFNHIDVEAYNRL